MATPSQSDILNLQSIAQLKYANLVNADLVKMQTGCYPSNGGKINCFLELLEALQIQINSGDFTSAATLNIYNQLLNLVDLNLDPNVPNDPNYEYPRQVILGFVDFDGIQGPAGKSAYEIWIANGNSGSQQDFLDSLVGATGPAGADGTDGAPGTDGASGATGATGAAGADGADGSDGADGDSAYQVWLNNGHAGTEAEFLDSLLGADGADGSAGADGDDGTNGWSPVTAIVTDVQRRVIQITDWTGGSGTKPTTGLYVGAAGLVTSIASAIDIRGPIGATGLTGQQGIQGIQGLQGATGAIGNTGANGFNGWSPVFVISAVGSKRVLQISDWVGGAGTKPATGGFIGATGLVGDPTLAVDIGGPIGPKGDQGAPGSIGVDGAPGAPGADGHSLLNGTGAPTTVGNDGDFYLDIAANVIYGPKASGSWPGSGTSIVGPAGATGAAGAAGATGATGAAGAAGAAGTNGNSVLNGTVNPTTQGNNGDFYINTTTNFIWGPKATGAWPGSGVSMVGPAGATGAAGSAGATGATGATGPKGSSGLVGFYQSVY